MAYLWWKFHKIHLSQSSLSLKLAEKWLTLQMSYSKISLKSLSSQWVKCRYWVEYIGHITAKTWGLANVASHWDITSAACLFLLSFGFFHKDISCFIRHITVHAPMTKHYHNQSLIIWLHHDITTLFVGSLLCVIRSLHYVNVIVIWHQMKKNSPVLTEYVVRMERKHMKISDMTRFIASQSHKHFIRSHKFRWNL